MGGAVNKQQQVTSALGTESHFLLGERLIVSAQSSLGPQDFCSHSLNKGIGENGMSRQEGESSGVGQTSPLGYLGFCVLFANHLDSRDGRMVSCEEEHSWG